MFTFLLYLLLLMINVEMRKSIIYYKMTINLLG